MTAGITGIGTALPPTTEQRALWDGYFRDHFAPGLAAERIFAGAGVVRRHAVVSPLDDDLSGRSTEARMLLYDRHALPLGHRAVTGALAAADLDPADVGQLTVASCTGYTAPGLDVQLAASLGLPADTQRLLVGHMGCYAALPALAAVGDYVVAHGRPAVLLCLELTSLHVQPPTRDVQQIVSHALFSDAAVALVLRPGGDRGLELVDTGAVTDPTAAGHMTWAVTDHGFRMTLSPRVPDVLGEHVLGAVTTLLGRNGLTVPDVRGWAVHPGGPRILETVRNELGLPPHALDHSHRVLREHGNCSSATVLLVLDDLLTSGGLAPGDPVLAMAFGPGLTLCTALLRAV